MTGHCRLVGFLPFHDGWHAVYEIYNGDAVAYIIDPNPAD